ncbi:MAG: nucleotidyltransferase family protein [Planctomycetota bacterium]
MTHRNGFPGLRPEAELLLAAAMPDRARALQRAREIPAGDLDLEVLLGTAVRGRLITLLLRTLRETHPELLAGSQLEQSGRRFEWRTLRLTFELVEILRACDQRGIEAVPYKGPALAALLYDEPTERVFKDLDLLVRPEQVRPLIEMLASRGYVADPRFEIEHLQRWMGRDCELRMTRPEPETIVEVHWHVLPPHHARNLDFEGLWDRRCPFELGGLRTYSFGPEDTLLLIAIHAGEKHGWRRLQLLADVARLMHRYPDIDYGAVRAQAASAGFEEALFDGLHLAWLLLGAPLPDDLVREARSRPRVTRKVAVVLGHMFRPDCGHPSYREWSAYLALARERATELGFDAGPAPTVRAYVTDSLALRWIDQPVNLPRSLVFLYYLYRPLRLLWKHRSGILRRI